MHLKLNSLYGSQAILFIFYKISEHRAIKNWAHFYKTKYFKIATYDNNSVTKDVLLFTYWKEKIIFREFQMIFDTKYWLWKSKNALFWWVSALSFCQIWKNSLASMNVDLKDYLILSASLRNVLPWITITERVPYFNVMCTLKYQQQHMVGVLFSWYIGLGCTINNLFSSVQALKFNYQKYAKGQIVL